MVVIDIRCVHKIRFKILIYLTLNQHRYDSRLFFIGNHALISQTMLGLVTILLSSLTSTTSQLGLWKTATASLQRDTTLQRVS